MRSLTVISDVDTITEKFGPEVKPLVVKVRAMHYFRINRVDAEKYQLKYQKKRLPELKTLKELKIPDGAQLYLEKTSK
ncbi:MAG: hypothetical protein ABIH76_03540 [Candidatus Bathyarchaeota archaeon]